MNVRSGIFIGILMVAFSITGMSEAVEVQVEDGSFRDLERVETALVRGVSNREDVKRLFGEPNGVGGAFLPTGRTSNEIWFYDAAGQEVSPLAGGIIRVKRRWQILLVFFDGEQFDGFLWFKWTQKGKHDFIP